MAMVWEAAMASWDFWVNLFRSMNSSSATRGRPASMHTPRWRILSRKLLPSPLQFPLQLFYPLQQIHDNAPPNRGQLKICTEPQKLAHPVHIAIPKQQFLSTGPLRVEPPHLHKFKNNHRGRPCAFHELLDGDLFRAYRGTFHILGYDGSIHDLRLLRPWD